jgi:hypothetical protein
MKSLIPNQWLVPKRFRERVGESAGRQRAMTEDGQLLLAFSAATRVSLLPGSIWTRPSSSSSRI